MVTTRLGGGRGGGGIILGKRLVALHADAQPASRLALFRVVWQTVACLCVSGGLGGGLGLELVEVRERLVVDAVVGAEGREDGADCVV